MHQPGQAVLVETLGREFLVAALVGVGLGHDAELGVATRDLETGRKVGD